MTLAPSARRLASSKPTPSARPAAGQIRHTIPAPALRLAQSARAILAPQSHTPQGGAR